MAEKDLRVLMDTKLKRSQQGILAVNTESGVLGCTGQSIASSWREVTLHLSPALMRPCWQCCAQVWAPQCLRAAPRCCSSPASSASLLTVHSSPLAQVMTLHASSLERLMEGLAKVGIA